MQRITPDQVVEALQSTGLKPEQGAYFQKEDGNCACGLGALYAVNRQETDIESFLKFVFNKPEVFEKNIAVHFDQKYGSLYRLGFVNGFDGEANLAEVPAQSHIYKDSPDYSAGYEDGKAAYKAAITWYQS